MSASAIEHFVDAAREFIAWVEGDGVDGMGALHAALARLQLAAASLPAIRTDDENSSEPPDLRPTYAEVVKGFADVPFDRYTMMFAPLDVNAEKPVEGSLADDLVDIYLDVLDGFRYYDAGETREAAWQWRFTYYSHWGRHLSHAQTAIWQYLADGGSPR